MPRRPQDISDATLRIVLSPGIGPATMRKLRERFGDDDRIISASIREFEDIHGIGRESATAIRRALDQAQPDAERHVMGEYAATLVVHGDADYPALLATIPDPPVALWVRGEMRVGDRMALAIVGSRKCTAYGRDQAGRFASLLSQSGMTIVSGGALGVDGEAHRGAMRTNGRTIVVLGCGLSTAYPPEHKELFDRIVTSEQGAIISEFPMSTPPVATNFPRRNRIISGLSLGVLVIEAAVRSGALITARLASEEHHREVMALPGRVDSPASAGCLKAIREGWAALVTSHADVIEQIDSANQLLRGIVQAESAERANGVSLFDQSLTPGQTAIVSVLREADDMLLLDQIAARTQLPLSQIMADLTLLQIRGRVTKEWSGGVRLKSPT